jgi:hypothetical protein
VADTKHPEFPPCQVKGHSHELNLVREVHQRGSDNVAYLLECPNGTYRFFFLETVWNKLGRMARYTRPRFGWKD